MPVNFLKTAIRHFAQNKLHTSLNIGGLAVGVACLLLAVFYWFDECSFDNFHSKKDQIFRLTTTLTDRATGERTTTGTSRQAHGPAIEAAVPEILAMTRVLGGDIFTEMRHDDNAHRLRTLFVDSTFFKVFDFQFWVGDSGTALSEINSVVLSEQAARRFFNSTDILGKLLFLDADPSAQRLGNRPMVVAGVLKKLPSNTNFDFDVLLPMSFMQLSFEDNTWLGGYLGTFFVLKQELDLQLIRQKLNETSRRFAAPEIAAEGFDPQQIFGLQPLSDIHLNPLSKPENWNESGIRRTSDPIFSNLFLGIAFFIFLLASINFVNISIAASLRRAREVGIRKINGGSRTSILLHFWGESALHCGVAFVLAFGLVDLALPAFNNLADSNLALVAAFDGRLAAGCALVFLLNVLFSGLYPAILLSDFKPAETLYARHRPLGQWQMGKILIIGQFALATILMLATVVFYEQMRFVQQKNLGYDPSFVLQTAISGNRDYQKPKDFLKKECSKHPDFEGIAFGGSFGNPLMETKIEGKNLPTVYFSIDQNYLSVLGHRLVEGKNFTTENSQEVIVNQAFVRETGLENPLGRSVRLHENYSKGDTSLRIVGVVEDFHFQSLRHKIKPLVMFQYPPNSGNIWLKINRLHLSKGLATFEKIYHTALPGAVFEYQFLDDLNAEGYARDLRWQKIISIFAALAWLICCLGLFGLSHLNAERRVREIGIRKILGATVESISNLLIRDFVRLVLLGILVASPLAYFLMKKWLTNFAYRIEIEGWMFIATGAMAVVIACLTVGFQSIRAALANPAKSLRSE